MLGKCIAAGPGTKVWRATDQASGELRALKFLSRHVVDEPERTVHALWDRIEVLRRVEHPCVVVPDGALASEGHVAIVMPWIDGSTIEEKRLRQSGKKFDYDMIRSVVCAWADAMEAAEQVRVSHGALKPSNVMLDRSGELRITDFGTAAWIATELGRRGRYGPLEKSLPYWSPAQIVAGGGSYWRDDIYAFGVIMYQLLTGRLPLPRRRIGSESDAAAHPPAIRGKRNRLLIPEEVEQVVMVCLEANPVHRPASFRHIGKHLDPLPRIPVVERKKSEVREHAAVSGSKEVTSPAQFDSGATGPKSGKTGSNGAHAGDRKAPRPRFAGPEAPARTPREFHDFGLSDDWRRHHGEPMRRTDEQSWYRDAMMRPEASVSSQGMGWMLKTLLVLVAIGLVGVLAAFAWIVTGHEITISWPF